MKEKGRAALRSKIAPESEETTDMTEWNEKALAEDAGILFTGRCPEGQKGLLCWTGSSLVISAKLSSWEADIEADWDVNTPYMGVLVDGAPAARFALRRGLHTYALLTGMDDTVPHEYALFRDTQPMSGEKGLLVRVRGMRAEGELLPPAKKPAIEVIGDSLTTGEGTVGPKNAAEWRSVWLSGMHSWAQALCRELDARGEWVSQSGWGIYTAWDGNRDAVIGNIYESAAAHSPFEGERHDFAAHPVACVVVNLGTNDWNALKDKSDGERPEGLRRIYDAVLALLARIHSCRPDTPVLFTYGMCGAELTGCLRSAVLEDAKSVSSPVAFLELPNCPDTGLGSRFHPGEAHQALCGKLIAQKLRDMGLFPEAARKE